MTTALTRLAGSAFEITLTLPWSDVKKVYDRVFEELAAQIEVEGFRKGKAPKEVVTSKIDKSKVFGEVVNKILPDSYVRALEEHNLKPVVSPRVQVVSSQEEKDWQFIVRACEKPTVDLDGYREAVAAINAKARLWVPGKDKDVVKGNGGEVKDGVGEERSKRISEIIDKLLTVCKVELAEVLLESEVNRLMSQLVDDVRQAGLTFEQYLESKGETADQIRGKQRKQAEETLKLEFILGRVADDLSVTVSQKEIDEIVTKETDEGKKKTLMEQSYILASILRREKTITALLTL